MSCYRTILVALDGSQDADAALRHATTLARDQHARLVLLTIVTSAPVQPIDAGGVLAMREIERSFARTLRTAVESLPADIGVESRLVHGKVANQILEIAREHRADLIIMGFHGHGRLREVLIGSTSATVLRESTTPVLLIRAHRGTAATQDDLQRGCFA